MSVRSQATCMAAVCVSLLFGASAATQPKEQIEIQKEGIQLIGQVEDSARDIRYNADRLSALAQSTMISKWSHNHHLAQIRSIVNEGLQPAFNRLMEIQSQLPAWKQQSINKMLQSAKALAGDTNSAILSSKAAGTIPPAMNAEYRQLIANINQHAETLVKTADAAGDYANQALKASEAAAEAPGK